MSLPSFQTNQLKSRRKALIDGHEFTVRRMGNIERLEVLQIQDEIKAIIEKYPKDAADADISSKDMEFVNKKALQSAEILIGLFDDGGDQSKSRALVRSLDDEDIIAIIDDVFNQTDPKNIKEAPKDNEES